mmetsp:Transcript_87072/g.242938  ORF Transcript_87072/g.242938 Transcript_87072/m.242938 type:complete len:158 (-) Transcript_87072:16-489(-)
MPALSESLPAAPPMEPPRPPQAHTHAAASTGGAGKKADEENMEKVPSGWATTSLNKDDSSSSIGSPQSPGPRRNASGITRVSSASKRVVDADEVLPDPAGVHFDSDDLDIARGGQMEYRWIGRSPMDVRPQGVDDHAHVHRESEETAVAGRAAEPAS